MQLKRLHLTNFRNYEKGEYSFKKRVNCLVGHNGAGKTNLLDAIYFLCLTKSHFTNLDNLVVRRGQDFFRLRGEFKTNDGETSIVCKFKHGKRKEFSVDEAHYERLADHIGRFPVVMVTPYDSSLINNGSEERRKFVDNTLSQIDREYLENLLLYNKTLFMVLILMTTPKSRRHSTFQD